MIALLIVSGTFVIFAVVLAVLLDRALQAERARVNELLRLLEAKGAPAEFAAYVHAEQDEPSGTWIFSEDGLIGVEVDD